MAQSESTTIEKSIDSERQIVVTTDSFQDLHDAIDKLENARLGHSSSSTRSVSYPTLGELLHMRIK